MSEERYPKDFVGWGQVMAWISVTDRLPQQGQEVLVYGPECEYFVASYDQDQWTLIRDEFLELSEVTHWMPLPSPPK